MESSSVSARPVGLASTAPRRAAAGLPQQAPVPHAGPTSGPGGRCLGQGSSAWSSCWCDVWRKRLLMPPAGHGLAGASQGETKYVSGAALSKGLQTGRRQLLAPRRTRGAFQGVQVNGPKLDACASKVEKEKKKNQLHTCVASLPIHCMAL